jgi:hypothetical protein
VKLGPAINGNGSEIGALLSPGGDALLFARDSKGPLSGELYLWRAAGAAQSWPPACPPQH